MKVLRSTLTAALITLVPLAGHAEEGPGFRYGGETFTGESLPAALRQQLFEMEVKLNEQRERLISRFVVRKYLEDRAQAEGKTVQALQAELLDTTPPDEAAVRRFYEQNRDRIPAEFEQVRDRIAQYLQQQQRQQGMAALIERVRSEKGYEALLPEPEASVFEVATEGYPSKGAADAEVTVVEFADFQCPYCKQATAVVDRILERYEGQVRVVYRDFPLQPAGVSREIAEGGVCAAEQDRFWDYHDRAFAQQSSLSAASPSELAGELGLDTEAFAECLESEATAASVERSRAGAERLGVSGTPSFFVNGRPVHVDQDIEKALNETIREALGETS